MFKHEKDSLVIKIPTKSPEELHSRILTGISIALKHCIMYPLESEIDADAIASLSDLQQNLLPSPRQLDRLATA